MKGWILVENNKPIECNNNHIEVFKIKSDLLHNYGGALGDCNSIKRVDLILTKGMKKNHKKH